MRPNLPSENEIYRFTLKIIKAADKRPIVLCPIKAGGADLANQYETALRGRIEFNCRRFDLEKTDDYIHNEYRRILVPSDFYITDDMVAITFDNRAVTGATQIGAYRAVLEAGAKRVLVVTDVDESGVSDLCREPKYEERGFPHLGPAKFIWAYMPNTYEEMLEEGLIPEITDEEIPEAVNTGDITSLIKAFEMFFYRCRRKQHVQKI